MKKEKNKKTNKIKYFLNCLLYINTILMILILIISPWIYFLTCIKIVFTMAGISLLLKILLEILIKFENKGE